MKNLRLYIIIAMVILTAQCFAESITFLPTMKIKAAVVNTANEENSMVAGENIFEYLYDNKYMLSGEASCDVNFSFYNPRGDQDSINYWKLNLDEISLKVLKQYDILLLPLDNNLVNLDQKKRDTIASWIENGGVLWIDNKGFTGSLDFLPSDLLGLSSAKKSDLNNNSAIASYPFNLANFGTGTNDITLDLVTEKGMNLFPNAANYAGNKNNLFNGVVKFGKGKVIYSSGKLSESKADVYLCVNLLFSAFSPNSNTSSSKLPSLFGDSLITNITYTGDKALVADGHVYYVQNGCDLYVDGVNLSTDTKGAKPEGDISAPAIMGDSDIVVYDSKGVLYVCSGLTFDNKGDVDTSVVLWLKLYESEDSISCAETIKFSPVVENYWAYYVDDRGNLNCVYTKDLTDGSAKYAWTVKGNGNEGSLAYSGPAISSRTDAFGSYITEVSWVMINDEAAEKESYMLCSIPVSVTGEVSNKQPLNTEPLNQIVPNYSGFPNITGNTSFQLYASEEETPKDVLVYITAVCDGKKYTLKPYDEDNKSKWDFKVNYNGKGAQRRGYIQLNAKLNNGVMKFSSDSAINGTTAKDFATQDFRFTLSYVPVYKNALRSALNFGLGMKRNQYLKASENGLIYQVKRQNDTDSNVDMTYINKFAIKEDRRDNSHTRYNAWSFLPHTGFTGLKGPLNENQSLNIASYIDWEFPYYTDAVEKAQVFVNGITTVNDKVYASLTAKVGMFVKSAVVCLNANAEPEIKIVDEDRNPVTLKYIQTRVRGRKAETNFSVKLYQPSVYNTEMSYESRVFNAPSVNAESGIIKADNMQKFGNGGFYQLVTSSLPIFVKLSYDENMVDSSPKGYYLPIYPGTSHTFDPTSYNNNSYFKDLTFPLSDGNENVQKKLYADLSNWNQVLWYAVLPGNTECFGEPVCTGDKVTVVGYENDEYGKNRQNKLFSINTKLTDGAKVRENEITVSNLSKTLNIQDGMTMSYGTDTVALSTGNEVSVLENAKSLVIDNSNILEIDPAGKVNWRLSKVEYSNGMTGADYQSYDFIPENPVRAKYAGDRNHIAVADAGTKTIFVMDKNGWLKPETNNMTTGNWWMFNRFTDPFGLLRSGASYELGIMSDFVYWTEDIDRITYHHFLVADTTYKRVLDLVIETDLDGNVTGNRNICDNYSVVPYLNWVTYDVISGNKFNFVSVDITEKIKDMNGNPMRAVVCGVSNYNASDRNGIRRGKGGSVLIYDYRMNDVAPGQEGKEAYALRFGKLYDTIGKKGDNIFDINTSDNVLPVISGLKKVVIENLDGRNYQEEALSDYTDLRLILCDEIGAIEYTIGDTQVYNGLTYYFWEYNNNRKIPANIFGLDDPNYDTYIVRLSGTNYADLMPGRFKPFTSKYYSRMASGNQDYITNYAPLKAPVIPMDVKVLSNGNWLVLNGYSGKLTYNYKNPYDGLVYNIEADYHGEVMEFEFMEDNGIVYPEIVWQSNQLKSFAIDDYVTIGNYTNNQLDDWNRALDEMDGKVYSPNASPIGYQNNIIGGFKYTNKALRVPKSLDR